MCILANSMSDSLEELLLYPLRTNTVSCESQWYHINFTRTYNQQDNHLLFFFFFFAFHKASSTVSYYKHVRLSQLKHLEELKQACYLQKRSFNKTCRVLLVSVGNFETPADTVPDRWGYTVRCIQNNTVKEDI